MTRLSAGVIGAGIYGVAAALQLRAIGADVILYEKRADILSATTARNFFRLHQGYHYPRHLRTARQARTGFESFMAMFGEAVVTPAVRHHYAIAAEGSLTSPADFQAHCAQLNLSATPVVHGRLFPRSVAACFAADEHYYSPVLLRRFAWQRLREFGVSVELDHKGTAPAVLRNHDVVVVTAYSDMNEVLGELDCNPAELQYEMCEVAVFDAPDLRRMSMVVIDGPFCSVAPYGDGLNILYDVVRSVHHRHTGYKNPGLVPGPTRFVPMLESARRFADFGYARYVTSLWAERVVLPNADTTDARPANVWWAGPNVLSVLSGKVTASVSTGRRVAEMVTSMYSLPAPEAVRMVP